MLIKTYKIKNAKMLKAKIQKQKQSLSANIKKRNNIKHWLFSEEDWKIFLFLYLFFVYKDFLKYKTKIKLPEWAEDSDFECPKQAEVTHKKQEKQEKQDQYSVLKSPRGDRRRRLSEGTNLSPNLCLSTWAEIET